MDPKFPDFQVPDFQISRNLAWAHLGPTLGPGLGPGLGLGLGPGLGLGLGPAWARLGPGLGPGLGSGPVWARLGPGLSLLSLMYLHNWGTTLETSRICHGP